MEESALTVLKQLQEKKRQGGGQTHEGILLISRFASENDVLNSLLYKFSIILSHLVFYISYYKHVFLERKIIQKLWIFCYS